MNAVYKLVIIYFVNNLISLNILTLLDRTFYLFETPTRIQSHKYQYQENMWGQLCCLFLFLEPKEKHLLLLL